MKGDVVKTPQGKGMGDTFEILEYTLRAVRDGVGTPLSARLNILSVLTHVAYVRRNLSALYGRWSERPPFVGEGWSELDFGEWANRIREAWMCGKKVAGECTGVPFFHVAMPAPEGMENWRLWNREQVYDRKTGADKDIDAKEYGKCLQPTSAFNEWFFLEEELCSLVGFAPQGMRVLLRSMSEGDGQWLLDAVDKEVNLMVEELVKLETVRTGLCDSMAGKAELDGVMARFYTVFYHNYADVQGNSLEKEYAKWGASCKGMMKVAAVKAKMKKAFRELLASGFLTPLLDDYGYTPQDADKAEELFRAFFFDKKGLLLPESAGRYIYTHQFHIAGWREMSESFFRFLYWETLAGTAPLPTEISEDDTFPPVDLDCIFDGGLDMAKVKAGFGELLTMKLSDGKTIQDRKYLCYVVFQALCDMKWLVKRNESGKFLAWSEKVYSRLGSFTKQNFDAGRLQAKKENESDGGKGFCDEMAEIVWQMFQGKKGERQKLYLKERCRPI